MLLIVGSIIVMASVLTGYVLHGGNLAVLWQPTEVLIIFGAALAYILGCGFVPIRKPGKLPAETIKEEYSLEYGTNTLEIHKDAFNSGDKILIVDDLLATGGTAKAAANLVSKLGGDIIGLDFLIELEFLNGRELLDGYKVKSYVKF